MGRWCTPSSACGGGGGGACAENSCAGVAARGPRRATTPAVAASRTAKPDIASALASPGILNAASTSWSSILSLITPDGGPPAIASPRPRRVAGRAQGRGYVRAGRSRRRAIAMAGAAGTTRGAMAGLIIARAFLQPFLRRRRPPFVLQLPVVCLAAPISPCATRRSPAGAPPAADQARLPPSARSPPPCHYKRAAPACSATHALAAELCWCHSQPYHTPALDLGIARAPLPPPARAAIPARQPKSDTLPPLNPSPRPQPAARRRGHAARQPGSQRHPAAPMSRRPPPSC